MKKNDGFFDSAQIILLGHMIPSLSTKLGSVIANYKRKEKNHTFLYKKDKDEELIHQLYVQNKILFSKTSHFSYKNCKST
jgi:hypothetical protein